MGVGTIGFFTPRLLAALGVPFDMWANDLASYLKGVPTVIASDTTITYLGLFLGLSLMFVELWWKPLGRSIARVGNWRKRSTEAGRILETGQKQASVIPVPDWRICEAMDYLAKELGSEKEQDVDAKYSGPAGLLTSKALAGEIQIWGKRLIAENKPELAQREIAPSEWKERELLIWACQPYTRKAQTRSVSQLATQQFTDLYVNKSQIKEIPWRGENAYEVSQNAEQQYDTPIHEAVEYVARKIDDCDSGKCYPSARRGLRKAAFEGQIKVYGKRELKKGYHSDLRTPVPPEFWDDQELNELATSVAYTHHEHTRAELGDGFKKLGSDREKYWDVRVSMDEVKKEWP